MPIAESVRLGRDVTIFHPSLVNLYGCTIGDETKIGAFVEIQKNAIVGARCKISSHTFICEGVVIEDEVFVGHGVMFTNDRYPRATDALMVAYRARPTGKSIPTLVKRGASIGSNATIICGVTIGEGRYRRRRRRSEQRRSADFAIVAGVPARRDRRRQKINDDRHRATRHSFGTLAFAIVRERGRMSQCAVTHFDIAHADGHSRARNMETCAPPQKEIKDMINIGVIGYGYWGPNLVRNFAETPGATVAAVADLDKSEARNRPAAVPGRQDDDRFPGSAARLRRSTRSRSATPVSTHFELGMAALKAGKHVWLEKPMAETSLQARKLIDEAERRKRVLFVDHTFIYTGAVRKMGEIIKGGELGKIYYYDSIRVNLGLFQRDVNVISDLAVHDFSILDYLLGEHPTAVSASGTNHFLGTPENLAYITLFYASGTIAHANVSWLAPVKVRQILIGGSKKMIIYDDVAPSEKVKVYDKGVSFTDDPKQIHEMRVGYRTGDMCAPKISGTEALAVESVHFVDCIEHGKVPETDGRLGLRVVELIEAATSSMRGKGETVYVPRQGSAS